MEATCSSEMSVDFQLTTRRHIREGRNLQSLLTQTPAGLPVYLSYVWNNVTDLYGIWCERCILKLSNAFQKVLAGSFEQDAENSGFIKYGAFIDSLNAR
jgi:hypothetical protein